MLTYRKLHRFTLNLVNGESHALLVDHVYAETEVLFIVIYALPSMPGADGIEPDRGASGF